MKPVPATPEQQCRLERSAPKICSLDEIESAVAARTPQKPSYPRPPLLQRFWMRVDKAGAIHPTLGTACWKWTGRVNQDGYGRMGTAAGRVLAPRLSWMILRGPIPADMRICHHCDNPPCVNPEHLFIGTMLDNARDRDAKGRHPLKTHCAMGHELTTDNTRRYPRSPLVRRCIICLRAEGARSYKRRRVAKALMRAQAGAR